jgi:2,3-bisphosphoglycerate-dependent phosphoglycerate mutase
MQNPINQQIKQQMGTLVLIRHGESTWNLENRFTGWVDVDLTSTGEKQAQNAGQALKRMGYQFDIAYTSVLKRAIKTLYYVLEEMDLLHIPTPKAWQLNERHYGSLSGLNKKEVAMQYGEEQVHIWRRSYDIAPPDLAADAPYQPQNDERYKHLNANQKPLTESLKTTIDRVLPYWNEEILPQLQQGKNILIAAHGNSLRGLIKHLSQLSEADILSLNLPNGVPIVYQFDGQVWHYQMHEASVNA